MGWLRLLYVGSIALVAALAMFAPLARLIGGTSAQPESAVRHVQLLEREDRWILQLELHNPDQTPGAYTVSVDVDGKAEHSDFNLEPGGDVTFIHHVYPDVITDGRLTLTIERAGDAAPIEHVTYYLRPPAAAAQAPLSNPGGRQ